MRRTLIGLLLSVGLLLPGAVVGTPSASGQETAGDSAVTKSVVCPPPSEAPNCESEFGDLEVTVSQTQNLINQTVRVSWTGGAPTPASGSVANVLQIMQCWGGDAGPEPTQCQFGTSTGGVATDMVTRHLLNVTAGNVDPLEVLIPFGSDKDYLPFWPAGAPEPEGLVSNLPSPFLDPQISNEVAVAPTRANGTGEVFFEVQTLRQSAGLDCGAPVTVGSTVTGRSCWLVIVPRGTTEVNGERVGSRNLESSPLSRTNWNQKIPIKLEFLPVTQACPIGAAERPVVGHETAVDAVGRWQRALCAGSGGTIFSYTQVTDDLARRRLVETSSPGLALMTNPIAADQVPPDRRLVYAPVALSGLTVAYHVERRTGTGGKDGERFPEMNLTPRLVAKLLTQSYRGAVSGSRNPDYLKGNPESLINDEDFLRYNPDYRGQDTKLSQPIVQLGTADATALLWTWILGDAEARAFLAGTPDQNMVVNPANRGIDTPPSSYPRNDQSCFKITLLPGFPPGDVCSADEHPFTNDIHEAGRAAGRGVNIARKPEMDPATGLVKYQKPSLQPFGQRSVMAVVDTATAARYEVRAAKLRHASAELNADGPFVAPTTESMLAGLAAMKPSGVTGVLTPDPLPTNPAAYPLTALSYAATAPALIDRAAGKDYATFLRYAADDGQVSGIGPGQLPFGYAPLPESLRAQTRAAAATIEAQAGIPVSENTPDETTSGTTTNPRITTPGTTTSGTVGGPTGAGNSGGGTTGDGATSTPTGGGGTPNPGAGPGATPGAAGPGAAQPRAAARPTPALPAPAVGALLVALLVCGGAAAALAPATHFYGATRRNETGEGGDATSRTAARSVRSWLTARLAPLARRR